MSSHKINVTRHQGGDTKIDKHTNRELVAYMDDLRLCGVPVSAQLLPLQLIRLKLAFPAFRLPKLGRCILSHLYKSNITHRVVTHKAQNIRYFDSII